MKLLNAIPNWQVGEMCGRAVAYRARKIEDTTYHGVDLTKCADCGKPSIMVIQEFSDSRTNVQQPELWGYCGFCEVG